MFCKIKVVLLILLSLKISTVVYAQKSPFYEDIKSNISFPMGFSQTKAEEITTTIAIAKLNLVSEGRICSNKEWELYLNKIAHKLLQNDHQLSKKIRVWCIKDLSANAISFIDGSIYINQGLIIHLRTEAELAFIIAHEIAHVMRQHALKEIELRGKIIQAEINTDNNLGRNYRTLMHSKENEFEADGIALKLVIQAGYNPTLAITSLSKLNPDSSLFPRINIVKLLSNEINNNLAYLDSNEWFKEKKRDEKTLLNITSSTTDQFDTHPDMIKRVEALHEQLKIYDQPENTKLYQLKDSILYTNELEKLSLSALLTAIDDFEYQTAILMALCDKFYFSQETRSTTLLKSLYFISQSKENKYDEELLSMCAVRIDSNLLDLNKILYSYDNNKFKKLIYGYAKKLVEETPNEDNYFYYALINESYLGKQTAQIIFQNMLNKFPNGKYALVVKQKLSINEYK
jgi:Zn-dependent protease with chaperone function